MDLSPSALMARARTPAGRKLLKYAAVSGISVVVYETFLFIFFGLVHLSVLLATFLAVSLSAIPSYILNRAWAWGKSGRSHLFKEVLPFWGMALLGLVMSLVAADLAKDWADSVTDSHLMRTFIVMLATLGAFGVLWVGKFFVLNRFMFGAHTHNPKVSV